jgi:hypothetical protein
MTHVDAGTIAALRDELGPGAPEYAHLRVCSACVAALAEASSRATFVAESLAALDMPVDLAAAKAATRARLDHVRAMGRVPRWRQWPLGRAAALLIATAGAASALTWTPIRSLWTTPEVVPAATPTPTSTSTPTGATTQMPTTSGIAVDLEGLALAVIVRGAAPGAVVEVVWTSEAVARVEGPAGSGFTYGEGRLEVESAAGDLRLELPRAARSTVEVDGRVWVERSVEGLSVNGPTIERTNDLLRFVVPGR